MAPYAPDTDTTFGTGVDDVEVHLNGITQDAEIPSSVDPEARWEEEQDINLHATHTGKFGTYDLVVDPDQEDRANEIKLCSFKRPHMRAFHYAWWCYHIAFVMWFAITPLLSEVQKTLNLTKEQIWSSSISAGVATIIMRFLLGPFVDKFGPRILMAIILVFSAIPTGLTGLVNSATGLTILRFFIGVGGSTFVMVVFWTSTMFTKKWVGTASATAAGWGNLGGGTTQVLMGSILFPLFKNIYNGNSEKAWRTVCAIPAAMGLITAFCVVKFTDDLPKGNFSKLKKTDQVEHVNLIQAYQKGILNYNTWLLSVQYGCCFGVAIVMNNAAALYFRDQFGLSTESAAAVASIFGWMHLFARGLGGYISDKANGRYGMRGRLGWQSFSLFMGGCFVVLFAFCTMNLGAAIAVLVIFAIFVQGAEGSTYGIVPYVNPPFTGSISGIIGAGGNVGSVAFAVCFRQMTFKQAYLAMGAIVIASSFLSIFVFVKGHPGLIWHTSVPDESSETINEDSTVKATNISVISKESNSDSEQTASDNSI